MSTTAWDTRWREERMKRERHMAEFALGRTAGAVAVSDDRKLLECVAKLGRLAEERLAHWPDPPAAAPQGAEREG